MGLSERPLLAGLHHPSWVAYILAARLPLGLSSTPQCRDSGASGRANAVVNGSNALCGDSSRSSAKDFSDLRIRVNRPPSRSQLSGVIDARRRAACFARSTGVGVALYS